ncbi:N-acetyltransferase domain-containing protein [Mycena sanguinolenta]|uniref:N-acetyltransferase domain-containing protein n=1 Tax=Mycena sanguinolenta TaxID=230812 RepID=A0A8H7DJK5_9AGAR|nr:N-acetyltransferase domain-containing protein [Mycena sanguinolenta]
MRRIVLWEFFQVFSVIGFGSELKLSFRNHVQSKEIMADTSPGFRFILHLSLKPFSHPSICTSAYRHASALQIAVTRTSSDPVVYYVDRFPSRNTVSTSAEEPISPAAHLPDRFTVESAGLCAEVSARTPVRFDPDGEPYIPLPAPFERFYLAAMRQSDLPHNVAMMSDLRVMRSVHGPPFPNPLINTQRWLVRERAFVVALFDAYTKGEFRPAASSPFNVLHERKPDWGEEEQWREVFTIGAVLNLKYHRQGVASAAVRVLLDEWAVPQMGCTDIHTSAFASHVASVRLWEKFAFVEQPSMRGVVQVPEAKGGVEADCTLV